MRFGNEAHRRYFTYIGVDEQTANQQAINPDHAPLPHSKAHSFHSFVTGMDDFFDNQLGENWTAPDKFGEATKSSSRNTKISVENQPRIIGLTGKRECGKSVIGDYLVKERGFVRLHPFGPGKAFLKGYYEARGASKEDAERMVDGDMKNVPADCLPINPETSQRYSSRWLMERLGRHMAVNMGLDYTIGAEIAHFSNVESDSPMLMESVVYEDELLRKMGGLIVRVVRQDAEHLDPVSIIGEVSDSFVEKIKHDVVLVNHMDGKEKLIKDFEDLLAEAAPEFSEQAKNENTIGTF